MGEALSEKDILPATPEKNEHKNGTRKTSVEKSIPRGSASPARGEEKFLPHYLTASSTSCHDLCKYGHKHAFDVQAKSLTIRERINIQGNKLNASSKSSTEFPGKARVIEKKGQSPLQEFGSLEETSEQERFSSSKQEVSQRLLARNGGPDNEQDLVKTLVPGSVKRGLVVKHQATQRKTSLGVPKVIKQKDLLHADEKYNTEDLSSIKKIATPTKNTNGSNGPILIKQRSRSFVRIPSLSAKTRSARRKASAFEEINTSDEGGISSDEKTSTVKSTSSPNISENLTSQRDQEKVVKRVDKSKITVENDLKTHSASPAPPVNSPSSSRPKQYIKRIASMKKGGKESNKIKAKSSVSLQESTSHRGKIEESKFESSTGMVKARLRQTAAVHRDDDSAAAYKLKFKSGQVVDLPPESSAPVKLRFSRGRVVEKSNSNVGALWRRSFSRKSSKRRGMAGVVYNDPATGAQVVILRHQDVQKKDGQGLINNVIEETAGKLVKTRKSKVKALVGAFESVISSMRGSK